ncbi:DMT family transporter [Lyngbya confervoides]|uniref:DMT family transporter n=1 Tax=Lyngbya confervoides BDU141951 TaxID=1574623 RepID=A0ABD4T066_9CYAN|nr:DMT family transporter [Lyngbya confervoides]MCM1981967.1 DMT family transporter [Lyngbya confervoides BDU141951]
MSPLGEFAAITAAFIWAGASVIYARLGQTFAPMGLNFAKGAIAVILLLLTPPLWQQDWASVELQPVALLALSGALGVGVGDTLFFETLKALGPRRTLLLEALAPAVTAALAWLFLQEALPAIACAGIMLTLLGIAWVIRERTPEGTHDPHLRRGLTLGLGSALTNSTGALLARAALTDTAIDPELAALVRIGAGLVLLISWGLGRGLMLKWCRTIFLSPQVKALCLAAFGGTYLGIWLQQVGYKYAPAGIAQTLLATSPLFILPITLAQGERVSPRAWLGAMVCVAGVATLFLAR